MKRVSSCILLVLVRLLLLLVFFSQPTLAVQGEEETEMMQNLLMQVQTLRTELESMRAELSDHRLKREQLEERVAELQSGKTDAPASGASSINQAPADSPSPLIDLQPQEYASITQNDEQHVLTNPWWKNIEISGFGAAGFYDTGSAGTRADGGFEIKEASLFFDAEVWKDISFFLELQTNRLGKDDTLFTRTGEVYAHFRNIGAEDSTLGIKLGRFDLPFGEEYLWQDAIDNPLITNSAAYPYGWDEGILIYDTTRHFSWIAAITSGTDARSKEENSAKALNLKI